MIDVATENLIRRLKSGEESAAREFCDAYSQRLFNALLVLCRENRTDAEDLAMRALERGYAKIADFKGKASLFSWLYRIAYRFWLMDRRGKARQAVEFAENPPEEIADERPDGADAAARNADAETLEAAVQRLPEEMRAVVLLRFYQNMAMDEIAASLGVPPGTVKSRLHYALERLRALLPKDFRR